MSLYQPGDTVRIRSDLEKDKMYDSENGASGTFATPSMLRYAGRTVTIRGAIQGASDDSWFYRIKEDGNEWWWCDGMFDHHEKDFAVDESDWSGFFSDYSQQKGGV